MAHKTRRSTETNSYPEDMLQRIAKARREARTQQALELARTLYKSEPNPQHLVVLRDVTFERGQDLLRNSKPDDAGTVFRNLLRLEMPLEMQVRVGKELAACGQLGPVLELLPSLPDDAKSQLMFAVADQAVGIGSSARNLLPEDWRPGFDAVLKAYGEYEAAKDDAARETLQSIGLQSPFLEWKLLIRGLLSYQAKDDAKALDNWRRLDAGRLPSRLVAPLREHIDRSYSDSLSPAFRESCQVMAQKWFGSSQIQALRKVQAELSSDAPLGTAFRSVQAFAGQMQQSDPRLFQRLAACFYSAIIRNGEPEDVDRFARVFGSPPDDPKFERLEALILGAQGQIEKSNAAWKAYEKTIANTPDMFPADQSDKARAFVWNQMARQCKKDGLFPIPDPFEKPKKKGISETEEYLRKSIALAPDLMDSWIGLFWELSAQKNRSEAIKVGSELVERFPNQIPVLEELANVEGDFPIKAAEWIRKALAINPLDRRLRAKASRYCHLAARVAVRAKSLEEARGHLREGLDLADPDERWMLVISQAVLEAKAKNSEKSEEMLTQARTLMPEAFPFAIGHLAEVSEQSLGAAIKKSLSAEVDRLAEEPQSPAAILGSLQVLLRYGQDGYAYVGQKKHQKKILSSVMDLNWDDLSESDLEKLCDRLSSLEAVKQAKAIADFGVKRFPKNPSLLLFKLETRLNEKRIRNPYSLESDLEKARSMIDAIPRGERQLALLERSREVAESLKAMNVTSGMMSFFMERMAEMAGREYGFDDEDDDDFEEVDW